MRTISLTVFLIAALFGFGVPLPEHRWTFPPLISGDAFLEYSDYAYHDADTTLNPSSVKPGSTVFVQANLLKDFFQDIHPKIVGKYVLITHNHDAEVPAEFKEYLDDEKIIAWFGENWDGYQHEKMHQIPMGMAVMSWPNGNGDTLKKVQATLPVAKEHLAHMGFTIQTNYKERWEVFKRFSQAPYVYRTIKKTFEKYLVDVAASHFEIAPKGFAWDTYRLWECLYIGTIPVVKTSQLDALYEGLPVLIIKDWKDVTENFLHEKYLEMSQKTYNMEKTTMEYWTRLIDSYKVR